MSTIHVWDNAGGVTNDYHDGGGVVIVTDRPFNEAWLNHVESTRGDYYDPENDDRRLALPEPDASYETRRKQPERVIVFPDSGCC